MVFEDTYQLYRDYLTDDLNSSERKFFEKELTTNKEFKEGFEQFKLVFEALQTAQENLIEEDLYSEIEEFYDENFEGKNNDEEKIEGKNWRKNIFKEKASEFRFKESSLSAKLKSMLSLRITDNFLLSGASASYFVVDHRQIRRLEQNQKQKYFFIDIFITYIYNYIEVFYSWSKIKYSFLNDLDFEEIFAKTFEDISLVGTYWSKIQIELIDKRGEINPAHVGIDLIRARGLNLIELHVNFEKDKILVKVQDRKAEEISEYEIFIFPNDNLRKWIDSLFYNNYNKHIIEKEKLKEFLTFEEREKKLELLKAADISIDDFELIEVAINRLPNDSKELIKEHYYEGISLAEIAKNKNQSLTVIQERLLDAIKILKSLVNSDK